jgi:hypothetical protein
VFVAFGGAIRKLVREGRDDTMEIIAGAGQADLARHPADLPALAAAHTAAETAAVTALAHPSGLALLDLGGNLALYAGGQGVLHALTPSFTSRNPYTLLTLAGKAGEFGHADGTALPRR